MRSNRIRRIAKPETNPSTADAASEPAAAEKTAVETAAPRARRPRTRKPKATVAADAAPAVADAVVATPKAAPAEELAEAFAAMGISRPLLRGLASMNISAPSEIQLAMAAPVLAGHDVVGQARTGTGKTIAFALPTLEKIDPDAHLQAMCLVPTRELATQVVQEIRRVAHYTKLRVAAIYGGQKISMQQRALERKPHFIVGTPGRLIDMMNRRMLDISEIRVVVLDEVDRMLDIGFRDDIRNILSRIRSKHQTILVSATIDGEIKRLIEKHTHDAVHINVSRDVITVDEVDQSYVTVDRHDKIKVLKMLLAQEKPELAIIFTNTKGAARRLTERLNHAGYKAAELHGDLVQSKREQVMRRFRDSDIHLLVATDLAARGIDVSQISHIINYDIPVDTEVYVHRIGRTARMGKRGTAITLVTREEGKLLTQVEMLINKVVSQRTLEGYVAPSGDPLAGMTTQPAQSLAAAAEPATPAVPRSVGAKHKPLRSRRFR